MNSNHSIGKSENVYLHDIRSFVMVFHVHRRRPERSTDTSSAAHTTVEDHVSGHRK